MVIIILLNVFFQCPQEAPQSQHSEGYKTLNSYACISCAPETTPEFGTFSTLATALIDQPKRNLTPTDFLPMFPKHTA